MSLIKLPNIKNLEAPDNVSFGPPDSAMARWNPAYKAQDENDASISILDVIGSDFFGEGVTAKRINAALRKIGDQEVTVNINSPGGDLFEGIAIFNILRDHPHKVTVRVMGMAASAASVIAMAGDEIQMGEGTFQMIHNVWVLAIGDRNVLSNAADTLQTFDDALAGIYAERTGQTKENIASLMDDETWFSADEAVEIGLADSKISRKEIKEDAEQNSVAAARRIEEALKARGMSSNERRRLIWEFKEDIRGKPADGADPHPTYEGVSREEIRAYLQ